MAPTPLLLDIPDELLAGIASGRFVLDGGVVRKSSGELVKLLKHAVPEAAEEAVARRGAEALKNPRVVAVVGATVVVAAAAAAARTYFDHRKPANVEPEVPACVRDFNTSLSTYLQAAREGNLDAEIIDRLIVDLDAVKAASDIDGIPFMLSPGHTETLIRKLAEHTEALAVASEVELDDLDRPTGSDDATIIAIRPYLEAQRDLFRRAA